MPAETNTVFTEKRAPDFHGFFLSRSISLICEGES